MSVTVTRDPRGVRVLVVAPGPQGVKGDQGDKGDEGPMPVVGTAAARDVPATGDATSAQVVLGSDTRLTDARDPRAHTHPIAEVTGLDAALAGKAASVHRHDVDDVDALPALLDALALGIDGCAPASHEHAMGQVVDLDTALAGKAASKHTHVASEVTDLGSAATCSVPAAGKDAAAAEVVLGRDTRLTNPRTPTAHAATHQPGGSDELPALLTLGNRLTWAEWTAAPGSFAPVNCQVAYDAGAVVVTASTTSIGGGWAGGANPPGGRIPVTSGKTVTARAVVSAVSAAAARDARMRIYWWSGSGTMATGPAVVIPLDGEVEVRHTAVAPAGVTAVSCFVHITPVVGEKFRLSQPALWIGAGGEVRPPGEPIPGLGWQRRSPAGGVDWVLERWDGTQWVLIDGDSGPRAVGASGWAHRRGQMVTWTATDVAAPVGWRDRYSTGQKCYFTADAWPTTYPGTPV